MRVRGVPLSVLAILLALPLGVLAAPEPTNIETPLPADDERELPTSHEYWVPYMDKAALDIAAGIRPGAWLRMGSAYCTASFVLDDPSGALYLTTAGHCTHGMGERVAVKQNTLIAAAGEWLEFGTVIGRWPSGLDAALIEIDPEHYDLVDPSMPGWGGPTGVATSRPDAVLHYGWGWVTWQEHQTRCRTGPVLSWGATTWWVETMGGGGDSGSGVMSTDGLAIGILDWGRIWRTDPIGGAFIADQMGGVRMDRAITALSAQTGLDLSLVEGGPVTIVDGAGAIDDACMPEPPVPAP